MPRPLKVYGWHGFRTDVPGPHHQSREIVAAASKAAAARAAGTTVGRMVNLCETGNGEELAAALAEPGTVFYRGINEQGTGWTHG